MHTYFSYAPSPLKGLFLFYVYEHFSTYMYVLCVCSWFPKRPKEVIKYLGIGVKDGCESPCELWDLNLGLPERATSALLVSTYYFTMGSEITNT